MLGALAMTLLGVACERSQAPVRVVEMTPSPALSVAPSAASPLVGGNWVDLSYDFSVDTIYWPTQDGFEHTVDFKGFTEKGYFYASFEYRASEHGGTHLDAPIHFAENHMTTEKIPLKRLIAPAVVVDVSSRVGTNADYLISAGDLQAWEKDHGRIPDGNILLLNTGWGSRWPDKLAYLGTDEHGPEAVAKLHFPGLDPEAAKWLVENRKIAAVGLDTASIDYGQSTLFESHRTLFANDIPAFENVANLSQLPPTGAFVVALPMKIKGGSGGPLRIVARLPE